MAYVQKLVTQDSFDATGTLVPAGHIALFDEEKLNGDEPHIKDVGDFQEAMVEVSPIAPTGPNPTMPQQIPPNARQAPDGGYIIPGKRLVGEVTKSADVRLDQSGISDTDREAQVDATLAEVMGPETNPDKALQAEQNGNTDLTDGTVADVTANLGTLTDAQLVDLDAAEKAGKNRTGVVSAIEAEQAKRTAQRS